MKDFIDLQNISSEVLSSLLDQAIAEKALYKAGKLPAVLDRKTLAMIFEKPSLRTRVSFETAMNDLGGHAIYLTQADIGLGSREPIQDVARVLGRMCHGIMARTFHHQTVEGLARWSAVPVINALTDTSHPCQAMADLMTVKERFGRLRGLTMTFVGDGNNVARSLAEGCHKLGLHFRLACPAGYELVDLPPGVPCETFHRADDAVAGADVIYTDTWVSMGQEDQKAQRMKAFEGFQVNSRLLAAASAEAIVLHCLPAYRECEISNETFEAHAETIFEESENRLHFQRTLLKALLADGGI